MCTWWMGRWCQHRDPEDYLAIGWGQKCRLWALVLEPLHLRNHDLRPVAATSKPPQWLRLFALPHERQAWRDARHRRPERVSNRPPPTAVYDNEQTC
ncbi:hypothetical protein AAFF_G00418260 [Aldrovandia affinis]|uniref:Uncharacterized protein n=1 Tax=Aldrovandia affinis TaxID=143900 RepID=A0AAD7SAP2_9TELE|nr:hypothetical protein AAFF_G00418260 [Aldrovandia affinis]